jgi:hypothetical protein
MFKDSKPGRGKSEGVGGSNLKIGKKGTSSGSALFPPNHCPVSFIGSRDVDSALNF